LQRLTALVLAVFIFGAFVPMFSAGLMQPVQAEAQDTVYAAAVPTDDTTIDDSSEAASNDTPEEFDQETPGLSGEQQDNCNQSLGVLSWIMCPVVNLVARTAALVGNWLVGILEFNPVITDVTNQDEASSGLYSAWGVFRDIANVLLIIAFIFIIYLVTTGNQAYAVQRMLPRLAIAAVGIQFSFVISALMVDIGNVLGAGIAQLFGSINDQVIAGIDEGIIKDQILSYDVPGQNIVGGVIGGVIATIGITLLVTSTVFPPFMVIIVSGMIGLFVAFLILGLRQLAIVALIVTSPLSFLLAIFPGTQGIFKEWSDNLIKLILIYPLVVLLFSISGLLSSLALLGSSTEAFNQFLASLLPVATLFMVPYLFRFAGRIFRGAGGLIQGGGKSMTKGLLGDYNDPGSARSRARLRSLTKRRDRSVIGHTAVAGSSLGKKRTIPGTNKEFNLPGLHDPLKTSRTIRQLGGGIFEGLIDPDTDVDMAKRWLMGSNSMDSMDGTEAWDNKAIETTKHGQYGIAQMKRDKNAVAISTMAAAGWIGGSFDRALNSYYGVGQQLRTGELAPDMAKVQFDVLQDKTKGANRALSVLGYDENGKEPKEINRIASGHIKSPRQLYEAIYSNDVERRQVTDAAGNRTGEMMIDDETRLKRKSKAMAIMGGTLTERNGEVDFRGGASILADPALRQRATTDTASYDSQERQNMIKLIERARSLDQRSANARQNAAAAGDMSPEEVEAAGFFGKSGGEAVSMKHFINEAAKAAEAINYNPANSGNPDLTRDPNYNPNS